MQSNILFSRGSHAQHILAAIAAGMALVGGLVAASAGVATAPIVHVDHVDSPPLELPREWRMLRQPVNFDHMFRDSAPSDERGDWIRTGSRR